MVAFDVGMSKAEGLCAIRLEFVSSSDSQLVLQMAFVSVSLDDAHCRLMSSPYQ